MENILTRIKEMGVLLILGSLLHYLLPSQEYTRYVRLLTMTILIAYFAIPVVRLFSPAGVEQFARSCSLYYAEILEGAKSETFTEALEEKVDQKWYEWGVMYLEEGEESYESAE